MCGVWLSKQQKNITRLILHVFLSARAELLQRISTHPKHLKVFTSYNNFNKHFLDLGFFLLSIISFQER